MIYVKQAKKLKKYSYFIYVIIFGRVLYENERNYICDTLLL